MILNDVHESFAWRHDLVSCTKLERFDQWGFHLRYLTQHVVAACVKIIWCAMMPLCLWDIRRMMDLEPWDAFFFCSFSIAQKWQSDTTWMDADWMGTGLGTVSIVSIPCRNLGRGPARCDLRRHCQLGRVPCAALQLNTKSLAFGNWRKT